ncbi:glycosyltransferase [Hymenobacter sp. 5516J-16]|uniref:glycosyltransferase n=1 Tax=Hymenobacter sp. 5516J-16 TaxID=2932253 RepID=UPI001FD2A7F3|nr:glycosyltransferase [Hymenobacter sp. 5516J-16]UOQ77075.1 glycosyltransferase [Hymenobacter sp. 5516J-16]
MNAPLDSVSIIIPAYNEAAGLGHLLNYLRAEADPATELLVVDAASPDGTAAVAQAAGARVVQCPTRGRAAQLNYGATHAQGHLLYFLHADTYPPPGFLASIRAAVAGARAAAASASGSTIPTGFCA